MSFVVVTVNDVWQCVRCGFKLSKCGLEIRKSPLCVTDGVPMRRLASTPRSAAQPAELRRRNKCESVHAGSRSKHYAALMRAQHFSLNFNLKERAQRLLLRSLVILVRSSSGRTSMWKPTVVMAALFFV